MIIILKNDKYQGATKPGDKIITRDDLPRLQSTLAKIKKLINGYEKGSEAYKELASAIIGGEQAIERLKNEPGAVYILRKGEDEKR
jgi:hypothetical protein